MILIPVEQYQEMTKEKKVEDDPHEKQKLSKDLILMNFADRHIKTARSLLSYVERCMDWNEKGEIIINGQVIEQSHVSDLLKDAIFTCLKNFHPQGYETFYEHLSAVPLSLIKNHSRRGLVGKGKTKDQTQPPPPGLPVHDQEARPLRSTIEDWKLKWQMI